MSVAAVGIISYGEGEEDTEGEEEDDIELGVVVPSPPPPPSPSPDTAFAIAQLRQLNLGVLLVAVVLVVWISGVAIIFLTTNWEHVLGIDVANVQLRTLLVESRSISSRLETVSAQLVDAQRQMAALMTLGAQLIGRL